MKNVTNLAPIFEDQVEQGPMDGDGEEPGDEELLSINIDIALNGYTVTYDYVESQLTYVFLTFPEVLEHLKANH